MLNIYSVLSTWVSSASNQQRQEIAEIILNTYLYRKKTLILENFDQIDSLPNCLPHFIEKLKLNGCTALQSLPKLPEKLKFIEAKNCSSLQYINSFPCNLREINLENCINLSRLPCKYPIGLEYLNIYGCSNLKSIKKLPDNLIGLVIKRSELNLILPKLPKSLSYIETEQSHYPEKTTTNIHELSETGKQVLVIKY